MSSSPGNNDALPSISIIGFTGHRRLQNPDAIARAIREELHAALASGLEIMAMSSVASGADSVFAREVLRAGIKWVAFLPFPKEMFREDFSPAEWTQAEQLMAQASEVRVLSGTERPQAYVDCGKATVDESDWLFAVWDGEPARGAGGTAEIVTYARSLGRPVTCFRETPGGVVKLDSDQLPPVIVEPREILRKIGAPVELPRPPKTLQDYFEKCDGIATRTAPNFRRDNLLMLGLLLGTTVLGGLSLSMSAEHVKLPGTLLPHILAAVKIFMTSWALWILLTLKRGHAHDVWVGERLKAEYCRSVIATWHCDKPADPISIHAVPMLRQLSQLVLLLRLEKPREGTVGVEQFRAAYAHGRVMNQLEYFRDQAAKAITLARPLRRRYRIYTLISVALSVIAFLRNPVKEHFHSLAAVPPWFDTGLSILIDVSPMAFPALASFTLTRLAIEDVDRRIGRFQDLQKAMLISLTELSFCGSWPSLRRTVERTEKILLHEVLEWYTVLRYTKTD